MTLLFYCVFSPNVVGWILTRVDLMKHKSNFMDILHVVWLSKQFEQDTKYRCSGELQRLFKHLSTRWISLCSEMQVNTEENNDLGPM
jgi:hypothetical protein